MLRAIASLAALTTLVVDASAGGVRIVDGSNSPPYASIQEAVDAAANGAALLVGEGSYAGFVVDGKGLAILAAPGASVLVTSGIEITDVPAGSTLVLAGLEVHALDRQHGIRAAHCAGTVLVQDCIAVADPLEPFAALHLLNCAWVAVTRSELYGGRTQGGATSSPPGGPGLQALDSSFTVHGSFLRGGDGLDNGTGPSDGGDGCHAEGSWFFAVGSTFRGGRWTHGCDLTGDAQGGAGLRLDSPAVAIDCAFTGGAGLGICPDGIDGLPIEGCCLDQRPGEARSFELVRATADGRGVQVSVEGEPYDSAYLFVQGSPVLDVEDATTGVPWVDPPRLLGSTAQLGVVPPGGGPQIMEYRVPALPNPTVARGLFLQGYVRPYVGLPVFGEPSYTLLLNAQALPDCDGDGIQDYVAVLDGVVADANHNFVPDLCEP